MTLIPGSRAWWAALAEFAATRAWCYHGLGMVAEARKWQGVAADCSAVLRRVTP
jgi:hypothetical protein